MPVDAARLSAGDELPSRTYELRSWQLAAYAGATWDWHPLHHDLQYATGMGFDRPIVDGQMWGALVARQVHGWFGSQARIIRMDVRYRQVVTSDSRVEISGTIQAAESEDSAELRVVVSIRCGQDDVIDPAVVAVRIPGLAGHVPLAG